MSRITHISIQPTRHTDSIIATATHLWPGQELGQYIESQYRSMIARSERSADLQFRYSEIGRNKVMVGRGPATAPLGAEIPAGNITITIESIQISIEIDYESLRKEAIISFIFTSEGGYQITSKPHICYDCGGSTGVVILPPDANN